MTGRGSLSPSAEIPDDESIRGASLLSDVILRTLSQSEYSSDAFTTGILLAHVHLVQPALAKRTTSLICVNFLATLIAIVVL